MLFRFSNSYNIGIYTTRKYTTCIRKNIILNIFNRMTNDFFIFFFFSSRRRHTRSLYDWSSDVCSSDLVQKALIAEQAAQCGYCMSGIAVSAAALLSSNPSPSESEVRAALDKHLCRCGSHNRVIKRSEERRVGKECRTRWAPYQEEKKKQ